MQTAKSPMLWPVNMALLPSPNSSRAISREVIGQLVTPQNTQTIPSPAPKEGERPNSGSNRAAKGGAGKEDRHDLPALEAGPQGQGGEEHFQYKGLGAGMPLHGGMDDALSRAVIVKGEGIPQPDQQGEGDDQEAARRRPQKGIREKTLVKAGNGMHNAAEENGEQSKEHAKADYLEERDRAQVGDAGQREGGGRNMEELGHPQTHDGGDRAGDNGRERARPR